MHLLLGSTENFYIYLLYTWEALTRERLFRVQPYVGTNNNRLVLLINLGACLGDYCEAVGLAAMFRLGTTSRSLPWH